MDLESELDSTIPYAEDDIEEISPLHAYRFVINESECGDSTDSEVEEVSPVKLFTHKFNPDREPAPLSISFEEEDDDVTEVRDEAESQNRTQSNILSGPALPIEVFFLFRCVHASLPVKGAFALGKKS